MSLVILLKWAEYNFHQNGGALDYAGSLNSDILKIDVEDEKKKLIQSEKTLNYNNGDAYSLAFKGLHK
jgi:hypothetical protein